MEKEKSKTTTSKTKNVEKEIVDKTANVKKPFTKKSETDIENTVETKKATTSTKIIDKDATTTTEIDDSVVVKVEKPKKKVVKTKKVILKKNKAQTVDFKREVKHSVMDAHELLKKMHRKTFDETIELDVNLGIDASKTDQNITTDVELPAPTYVMKKIVIITDQDPDKYIKEGAYKCGDVSLVEEIVKNKQYDFDLMLTEKSYMPKILRFARDLGPKGLLPNLKKGTITDDLSGALKSFATSRILIRNDKNGVIHCYVGKIKQSKTKELEDNISKILVVISRRRPKSLKGDLIKSVFLSLTMSKAVQIKF